MAVELGIKGTFPNKTHQDEFLNIIETVINNWGALPIGGTPEVTNRIKALAKATDLDFKWLKSKTVRIAGIMRSDRDWNL